MLQIVADLSASVFLACPLLLPTSSHWQGWIGTGKYMYSTVCCVSVTGASWWTAVGLHIPCLPLVVCVSMHVQHDSLRHLTLRSPWLWVKWAVWLLDPAVHSLITLLSRICGKFSYLYQGIWNIQQERTTKFPKTRKKSLLLVPFFKFQIMMPRMARDCLWLSRIWDHVKCFQQLCHTILMEGIDDRLSKLLSLHLQPITHSFKTFSLFGKQSWRNGLSIHLTQQCCKVFSAVHMYIAFITLYM